MERKLDRLRQAADVHGRNLINFAVELDEVAGALRRSSKPSLVHLKSIADRVRYIGNDLLTEADCAQPEPEVVRLLARLGRFVLPHVASVALLTVGLAADTVTLNAAIAAAEMSQTELEHCSDPSSFDDPAERSEPLRLEIRPEQLSETLIVELKNRLLHYSGPSPVYIHLSDHQAVKLADDYCVDVDSGLVPELRVLLGANAVILDS